MWRRDVSGAFQERSQRGIDRPILAITLPQILQLLVVQEHAGEVRRRIEMGVDLELTLRRLRK